MVAHFLPRQGLRARLIFLCAAPPLVCLLVTGIAVSWLVRDLHRDTAQRTLDMAAGRLDMRLSEIRGRMEGLAERFPPDGLPESWPEAGERAAQERLRGILAALRDVEPAISTIEWREALPDGSLQLTRWGKDCRIGATCGAEDPAGVIATVALPRPEGSQAEIRIAASFGPDIAQPLAAAERGAILLLAGGQVLLATPPFATQAVEGWVEESAPAWLLAAMAEGRAATGLLSPDGRNWLARVAPFPPAHGEVRPWGGQFLVLMLPMGAGMPLADETFAVIALAVAGILAIGVAFAAGAARRLGVMLGGLTEALRRLGRGDLTVAIPPPARDAPQEVIELTDACVQFRDAAAERARLSERLRWLANFDGLTGLPNRALFGDRLELAVAAARRDGRGLCVLAMDLDHFKEVNDTLGHAAGDEVLRQVASRLRGCLRVTDTLARIGGDEFVLVAPEMGGPAQLAAFAGRMLAAMEEPIAIGTEQRAVGLSIGAAILVPGTFDARPEALMQDADLALYQAKAAGGGCLRVFEPEMDERLRTRRQLVADLRNAVGRQELTILFQPQVSTATRRITGAEALLRWYHPQRGLISPDTFIPLAEETGLVVPIGAWVLEEACLVARSWPGHLRLAVNVSAIQVRQASFVQTVEGALARSGLPAERLELEITEAAMLANTAETLGILSRLRSLGVRLAMDDFGTGYSSLATLQRFRFDKIKVDRSFIRHIAKDAKAVALLRAVIALGSALDVTTNAEGVEDEGQLSMLRAEGCEEAQGFLFGRPMSAADFAAQVDQQNMRAA